MDKSDIDKLLKHFEQSEMFEKLVLKTKKLWFKGTQDNLSPVYNNQSVDDVIGELSHKKEISQDKSNQRIEELEQTIKKFEQDIQILQNNNVKLNHQLAQARNKSAELEKEKMGLLDLFKGKEKEISHLQQQINGLNQDKQKLQQNNERLNGEIQQLNQKLNSFNWANSLKAEFDFLKQVQNHSELANILLPQGSDNVLQLITIASQWNNVLRVWDTLAAQAKDTKQCISTTEQQILEHSLALYNLTLQNNRATLKSPQLGDNYDYDIHQKVSGSGGHIEQVLLAGLYNAAGDRVRSAVVVTR